LLNFESVDVMDALASSITLAVFNNKVMRIVPSLEDSLNEEWITNKARHSFDALAIQRINYPKLRLNDKLIILSWVSAFYLYVNFFFTKKFSYLACICGSFLDLESGMLLKDFFNGFGCSAVMYETPISLNTDFRFLYLLNTTLVDLETTAIVLLIGTNLRLELPLINARVRKNFLNINKTFIIYSFGLAVDYLTIPVKNFGSSLKSFKSFVEGKLNVAKDFVFSNYLNLDFLNFKYNAVLNPVFFVGQSLLTRHDADTALNAILYIIKNFFETNVWRSLNVVSQYLGSLSTYELGFSGGIFNTRYFANSFLHLSSVNKINIPVVGESFIVYQGFYESSDYVFTKANLILPVLAYSERASTYINIEGRLRFSKRVIMTFKLLHNDFEIIKGLLLHSRNYFSHNFSILSNFQNLNFFRNLLAYKPLVDLNVNNVTDRLLF